MNLKIINILIFLNILLVPSYANSETSLDKKQNTQVSDNYFESDNGPYRSDIGEFIYEGTNKNGEREGLEKIYYKSGKLRGEVNYKNGKREGLRKTYYETGQLMDLDNYINGKREGLFKGYFKSGKLNGEGII
ncbi:hypothetical protein K8S19_12960 [bacterium]|nr:hypothetical protein [bacterium]